MEAGTRKTPEGDENGLDVSKDLWHRVKGSGRGSRRRL